MKSAEIGKGELGPGKSQDNVKKRRGVLYSKIFRELNVNEISSEYLVNSG